MTGSIFGNRVIRREDPELLRGEGTYVDDVVLPGAARLRFVSSPFAHARIASIDLDEATALPGVLGVFTVDDLGLDDLAPRMPQLNQTMMRPVMARGVVRFVGEPVVAVVAETAAIAEDACDLVFVDYEPLDVLVDPEVAMTDGTILHDEAGTNIVFSIGEKADAPLDGEVVVRQRVINQRLAPAPIETRVSAAYWEDGRLIQHASSQGVHPVRDALAEAHGLEHDQVRVIGKDVGGGFGAKGFPYPEDMIVGAVAKLVGRPVKWMPDRSADLVTMGHGRGQIQDVEIAGTRDGEITSYRIHVTQDAGAYPAIGALLPMMTRFMASGCYSVTDVQFSAISPATNTTPIGAYRGAGRPEAAAAIERMVDMFATEIGMDPVEVRRRNLLPPDVFPYTTPTGITYDVGDYIGSLERAVEAAGYEELRAEQARRREAGDRKQLGIGVATYVEITAGFGGSEYGSVELLSDGRFRVLTGSSPYGQGHLTAWAMLASERLGVAMDRIDVVFGDTDVVPTGSITGGSRSLQIAGSAIHDASLKLVDAAKERAATRLEAAVDDITFDSETGRFHVAGTPALRVGWDDLAADVEGHPLEAVSDFAAETGTFPFGSHVAVVEVDVETGQAELVRMVACDDAGTILNELIVEGQVHGGLGQGVAQALYEEFVYDEDGNPLTSTLADYTAIAATELPMFERVPMETPTPVNPLGAKGIGESGTIGATPAVQNAVIDAVAHLGVRHVDMPCTPQRVWAAINDAAAGS